ncbi:ribonuclease H-like domain-containing protein [Alkalicoccobacillus plakortidis]|uniref:Ribonuclease H-like domain-containing protein n=1 Tax=Alkalicoccobacillus plakortidis TaxID=444060 RepID=A0ABT0XFC3_9BACI|nr:ribonuclease H-like domain-containing protein [Alkalicoccobacillus plakortidis]MCM2674425.1 ribonuclease H-like domain-containing protein [Alkalicoccobacillus plakortidis]
MQMRNKLNRLQTHTGLKAVEPKSTNREVEKNLSFSIDYQKQWEELGATIKWLDEQYVVVREVVYPLDIKHGHFSFNQLESACLKWEKAKIDHPLSSQNLKSEQLLFFDTETTGLYTGAGHHIFLLGYAQVKKSGVHVTQYLLPGPEAEAALYYHFLKDVDDLSHLVTYNGKAFDWPQVKTRHTFVRDQVPKLPAFGHFDLLHASRRLWSDELPSCKLPIVEEHKLGFKRQHDTPSYLVPMLYFDFVRDQDPVLMEGVLKHHEWDLLSLISLYIELSFKLTDSAYEQSNDNEHYEMGRWYTKIGEQQLAYQHLQRGMMSHHHNVASKSVFEYAGLVKKQKNMSEALAYYKKSIENNYKQAEAAIECAKMMEHTFKDLNEAEYFTNIAMDSISNSNIENNKKLHVELNKRLDRLQKKLRM